MQVDWALKSADPYTLEVTLENPTPYFLSLLYHHSLYPVHQATVEKHGMRWTRPENIVSNGPFSLKKWKMNQVITLEKNPSYWDACSVKLEKVNFYAVEKSETEEKMFLNQEASCHCYRSHRENSTLDQGHVGGFEATSLFGNLLLLDQRQSSSHE